jgi:hypothetical protein
MRLLKKAIPLIISIGSSFAFAKQVTISGKVINSFDQKPVDFATILILDDKQKTRTDELGIFSLSWETERTSVSLLIRGPGIANFKQVLSLANPVISQTFTVQPARIRGKTLVIKSKKDVQQLSRKSLSKEQLKKTPATLGDSLGALATLPGIIRTGGFLGPLIIRGASDKSNRYLIDQIPILYPQHFGALQSIISNELISNLNVYSSAFPADYGQANGAVIEIDTVDKVKELNGVIDANLISSNFYIASNIGEDGYWIAAGRLGYLTLIIPAILRLFGEEPLQLPEYYDYQFKFKYFLDKNAFHSLTFLAFGSYDTFGIANEPEQKDKDEAIAEGADPLGAGGVEFDNDIWSNNQGFYYKYRPSAKFNNNLYLYNTINDSLFKIAADEVEKQGLNDKTINVDINPNISAIGNKTTWQYIEDVSKLDVGLEAQLYWFKAKGQAQAFTRQPATGGQPDLGDDSLFVTVPLDFSDQNVLLTAFARNTLTLGSFEFKPGIRTEYLQRTNLATIDPRAYLGYTFEEAQLTVSGAVGIYNSFAQTNQAYFNQPFNQQPQLAIANYLAPEKAIHYVVGFAKKFGDLYELKIEGFYNEFSDIVTNNYDTTTGREFANLNSALNRGVEILFRKDIRDSKFGGDFYGWISYTYTDAKVTNGVNLASQPFQFEQPHALKVVTGFEWGAHSIGARFEFFSGFPYTPITGDDNNASGVPGRYAPAYGDPYSQRFAPASRLDVRYTYVSNKSWGKFSWYLEFVNVYNYSAESGLSWKYNQRYESGVNPVISSQQAIPIFPYFGLEWQF